MVELQLIQQMPDFILPPLSPPNSPDLNLVDCMGRAPGASLREEDQTGGGAAAHYRGVEHLDQCVIDNAVKQWRKRLRACVAANCGYFEHLLIMSYNF